MKKRVLILVIALFAIFTLTSCSKKFTVTFDSDGGTPVASVEVKKGKTVAQPTNPTKEGSEFMGWTLNGEEYNFSTKVTKDITLKAKWEVTEVTITFNTNGGSAIAPIKVQKNGKINPMDYVPTREGYKFLGWRMGTITVTANTTFTENVTLSAVWAEDNVTVTYNPNDGTFPAGTTLVFTVKRGQALSIEQKPDDPSRDNFDFGGWLLNNEPFDFNTPITEDITLYAKWNQKAGFEYVTVTFNSNGGSEIHPIDVVKGSTIALESYVPTRSGYDFIGWKLNGETVTENTPINEDVTLVAEWKEATRTVTFNTNGGSTISPVTVKKDSTINLDDYLPTRNNYEFVAWFLDSNFEQQVNGEYIVTTDITLYAKWNNKSYSPKWDPAQQVGGWTGNGMNVNIMVLPASSFDPFNTGYNSTDQKIKQKHQRIVEAAYDIKINYVEWGNNAAWGPDRIQFIKDSVNGWFRDNDVYIINITASWIPTLVRDECLAALYNVKDQTGIFSEIGYKETYEGSGVYEPAPYEQAEANNQATTNANVVYGYVTGKSRPDYFMYYNVDLINESGLDDPAELWFKGEWTWSNFEKYAQDLQTYLTTKSTAESEYKALAMGFPEFFIGSCGSTGSQITNVSPARLFLNSQTVIDQLSAIQTLVNSGCYDKTRGVADVASSFTQGLSAFVHGDLWFLNDPSRFDPSWTFEIGCVPYPTADGEGGITITTDDIDEAILAANGEPLTTENGEYIKGVDMSNSSFKVPFTTTGCYSVVNTPAGKNGINNKIVFAIMYDLFDGQGVDPDAPKQTEDEAYRNWLVQKKFDSEIYADVIMSIQDCSYFELIDMVSMSVGGGSQFGPNTLWRTIPSICTDSTKSPSAELDSIYSIYRQQMRDMGYMVP